MLRSASMSRPKVSVVVPVFNPGEQHRRPASTRCSARRSGRRARADLRRRRLDGRHAGAGSTRSRREHAHVRVEHIPNSGWPGGRATSASTWPAASTSSSPTTTTALGARRRSSGCTAMARQRRRGHRDRQGRRPRQARHARRRSASNLHGVRFRPRPALLGVLTPHKLFRRALPRGARLRFPEGRRRLEDHVFVVPALLRAPSASPRVADHPVYHWVAPRRGRRTRPPAASTPRRTSRNVSEVLDLVEADTEPGAVPRPRARPLVPRQDAPAGRRACVARPGAEDYRRELSTPSGRWRCAATPTRPRAPGPAPARALAAAARRRLDGLVGARRARERVPPADRAANGSARRRQRHEPHAAAALRPPRPRSRPGGRADPLAPAAAAAAAALGEPATRRHPRAAHEREGRGLAERRGRRRVEPAGAHPRAPEGDRRGGRGAAAC